VLTPRPETWPLNAVAWFVEMEIQRDVDMLDRVNDLGGVTVEALGIGGGRQADFLVAPALPPLPASADLPNGTMRLLVATRITREEMNFAREHKPAALIQRLTSAGVGQMSDLERQSFST
jgi:hypothetical protein